MRETSGLANIIDYFYLGPGEEKYIGPGGAGWFGLPCDRYLYAVAGSTSGTYNLRGASSVCQNSSSAPGVLDYKSLGFEYIEYLDSNQQITKRQIGKDFIVKCLPPA